MNEKMAHQKIIYQLTDKRISAASGIGMVGDILERAAFLRRFRDVKLAEKRSRKQIDAGAVMATFIALLCMGKPDFECVRELQNDAAYYQNALHLNKGFPSSATLRQRMDEIGNKLRVPLLDFNTDLLRKNEIQPTPLKIGMVPVDMDVTPMDNSKTQKEGIGWIPETMLLIMSVSCWTRVFITSLNAICVERIETNGHPISVPGAKISTVPIFDLKKLSGVFLSVFFFLKITNNCRLRRDVANLTVGICVVATSWRRRNHSGIFGIRYNVHRIHSFNPTAFIGLLGIDFFLFAHCFI